MKTSSRRQVGDTLEARAVARLAGLAVALLPLVPFGTTGPDAGRSAAAVEAVRPSALAPRVAAGATDAPGMSRVDASAEARPEVSATPAPDPSVGGAGGSVQVEAGAVRFVEE